MSLGGLVVFVVVVVVVVVFALTVWLKFYQFQSTDF
jgi:hypothetical protein